MAALKEQFLIDEQGNKIGVFLPISVYNEMMDSIEELEDIRLYDEVKALGEESISFEQYVQSRADKKDE